MLLGQAAPTAEVLVLTTATELPAINSRAAIEIQNLGPNPIFCALKDSAKAVVNKARRLDAVGGQNVWAFDAPAGLKVYCIASTANQVTTAATIVTQLQR